MTKPILEILLILTLLASHQACAVDQSKCKYWLRYFDRVSKWEKAKLKSISEGDLEQAEYFRHLIKREIEDVNDDTDDETHS